MSKKEALQMLAKVAEGMFLSTGIIDSENENYMAARKQCIDSGVTVEEILSVGDALMNKYYMKTGRYHVPAHIQEILAPVLFG